MAVEQESLYLCRTANGIYRHLARPGAARTLCGRVVDALERNYQTSEPVVFADHWRDSATTTGHGLCEHCEAHAP